MSYFIGIDIGGTKVAIALADHMGKIIKEDRIATRELTDGTSALNAMADTVKEVVGGSHVPWDDVMSIGVGSPGPLNNGTLLKTANLRSWEGINFKDGLSMRLNKPVFVENDATAAAIGEWMYGAGKNYHHMIYITVSTGIGSGIIVNGQPYSGGTGNAGEFGHLVMNPKGIQCNCGNQGCLETIASGTAIRNRGRALKNESSFLGRLSEIDTADVFSGVDKGDPVSMAIIDEAVSALGLGVSYLVNLFNPEIIVLGGGVIMGNEGLVERIAKSARRFSTPELFTVVTFQRAKLAQDSGTQGAIAVGITGLSS